MRKTFAFLLAACLFGGCSQTTSIPSPSSVPSETPAAAASAASASLREEPPADKDGRERGEKDRKLDGAFLLGRVTAIEGSTLTLETMGGRQPGVLRNAPTDGGPGPNLPNSEVASGTARPDRGGKPDGGKPDRSLGGEEGQRLDGAPGSGMAEAGQEETITIPDGCEILIDKDFEQTTGCMQ